MYLSPFKLNSEDTMFRSHLLYILSVALSIVARDLKVLLHKTRFSDFNIQDPSIVSAISTKLGSTTHYHALQLTAVSDVQVWLLTDTAMQATHVAKWRPASRRGTEEVESLVSLYNLHPDLWRDSDFCIPELILDLRNSYDRRTGFLLLAKKARGEPLTTYIFKAATSHDVAASQLVYLACRNVAMNMCKFHKHYGKQHGDMHSSNVIVDEYGNVRFIDVATMGKSDVADLTYFTNSLRRLEQAYNFSPLPKWSELYIVILESYRC